MSASGSNSSVVELTSDVNSTVEQLRELGAQLKSNGRAISEQDIEEVIGALRELDDKRYKAHELLEAETIKASILRHKLANFPHKLKAELNALISSARESNAAEIKRLQDELVHINKEADQAEKTQEVLELHNQVLEPEQANLKTKHTDTVQKLNACMGKKAKMQIKLNDTRQKLNATNAQLESLEKEIKKREQEMLQVEERFAQERRKIFQQIDNSKEKCDEKKKENFKLSKKLEMLRSEVVETAFTARQKKKELCDARKNIQELRKLEEELKTKLEDGAEMMKLLEQSCVKVEQETVKMREDHATKKAETIETTRLLIKEQELKAVETSKLVGLRKGLNRDYKHAQEGKALQARALKDMQENVGAAKNTLQFQTEEGARLMAENKDLSFRVAQVKESHVVNVQLLRDEITDMKVTMEKEKKTREVVEETYNVLQAQIEKIKVELSTSMSSLGTSTSDSQVLYASMVDKAAQLEEELQELYHTTATLSDQLNSANTKLNFMKTSLTEEVERLEHDVADMTDEITDRKETLSELEPMCESLEAEFKEKNDHYESRKKVIIVLKSKRSEHEDAIKRIEGDLEKIHLPQEKLRMEALRCRAYTRKCLRERVVEVEVMEKKVVEAKQQLAAITNENKRIEKASCELREEIQNLTALSERGSEIGMQIDEALQMYKNELSEQWKENNELETRASARDKVVLNDLSIVKNVSEERLETITALHGNFDEEVHRFTEYLETTATVNSVSS